MRIKVEVVLTSGSDGVFYPGQEVIGEVIVGLTKTIKVSRVKLLICGVGKTEWSEANGNGARFLSLEQFLFQANDTASSTVYSGKERYLYSELVLCQVNDFMQSGGYSYGFACPLPKTLPASFEGNDGHIRYSLTATLERPWKHSKSHSLNFQVSRQLDISNEILLPLKANYAKTLGCWPCMSAGSLSMSVQLTTNGFVPGQIIPALVIVDSRRNVKIRKITTVLMQKISYTAHSPKRRQRIESTMICRNVSPGITLPEGGVLAEDNLQVPYVLPSTSSGFSRIIKVAYELRVTMEIDTCFLQDPIVTLTIPIVIGTLSERDSELSDNESVHVWSLKSDN
ncbi:arrestin domain-containing protein 2-like [Topomyia yanbarensis]|uniref:arrestin domain-containing protein 2-like n=1 Tax=Topomyia yanbarensis TaxID=2498891 RepID=UPI00273AD62A|nr:arrestin domain-containing protein 2-like [Topomyia yanbarensis]